MTSATSPLVLALTRVAQAESGPTLDGLEWEPFREGVDRHVIYDSGPDGSSAALLRYRAGAAVPVHEHTGFEHIYVLTGSQEDDRGHYAAGTLVVNPPGSRHRVRSSEGCVVLAIWQHPVRFVPSDG